MYSYQARVADTGNNHDQSGLLYMETSNNGYKLRRTVIQYI